jgi:hypothetical protein
LPKLTELRLIPDPDADSILISCEFFNSWKLLTSLTLVRFSFSTNTFPFLPKLQKLVLIAGEFNSLSLTSILNGVAPYLKIFTWISLLTDMENLQIPPLRILEEFKFFSRDDKLLRKFMAQIYSKESMRKLKLKMTGSLKAHKLELFYNIKVLYYDVEWSDPLPNVT